MLSRLLTFLLLMQAGLALAAPACLDPELDGRDPRVPAVQGGVGGTGRAPGEGGEGGIGGTGVRSAGPTGGTGGTGMQAQGQGGLGGTGARAAGPGGVGGTGARAQAPGGMGGTGQRADAAGGVGGTGRAPGEGGGNGGIGGTGIDLAGDQPVGIVGVITGFASVCLNGVHVEYDASTPVSENGRAADAGKLAVGQVVSIEAVPTPGGGFRARDVAIVNVLEGPLGRTPDGAYSVMGQRIVLMPGARAGACRSCSPSPCPT